MNHKRLHLWIAGLTLILFLAACGVAQPSPAPSEATEPAQYSDPFAYCSAVGTIDTPDEQYTGPDVPEEVVAALRKAMEMPDDTPAEWVSNGTVWRCMDGKVWACFVGANLPCTAKADTNDTPSPAMEEFCKADLNSDFIPAAVTGRETVYEWRCTDGVPKVVKQAFETDAQDYLSDFWYELSPE